MSDRQLYLAIGLPALIAIFNTGIVVTLLLHFTNKLDAKIETVRTELSSEIRSVRTELGAKIDSGQRDMREFYATQRQHDTRLEAIERKTNPS